MAVLIFWWMLPAAAVAMMAFFGIKYWLARKRQSARGTQSVPVAHTSFLTELPEYVKALAKYGTLLMITIVLLGLGLLSALLITARPSLIVNLRPVKKDRDIMLCLDDSGSVLKTDAALINRFSALVNNFQGQRVGLTLFNSSAVSVFPLNDDYPLISQRLGVVGKAFKEQSGDTFTNLTSATLVGYQSGTSLTSDGLASCIQNLGNSQGRSQSIIFATDNEVNGKPVVTMIQAITLARQQGAQVFAIDPGVSDPNLAAGHKLLQLVATQTGGGYYLLNDNTSIPSMVKTILKQSTATYTGVTQPAINDTPQLLLYAAVIFTTLSMWLAWRWGL